jgi:hypothetical protein
MFKRALHYPISILSQINPVLIATLYFVRTPFQYFPSTAYVPKFPKWSLPFRFSEKDIVRFEVFTAVVMKSTIFWNITSCSPLLATCFHAGFLLGLFFDPEDGGDMFLRNVG